MRELLANSRIVPVVKIENAENAAPMAQALLSGGINVAEITFRTHAAATAIEKIRQNCPEMTVIAGTVLSIEQAKLAVACGARGIVSPGTNQAVVRWCQQERIPVCPGCATPTEIETAMDLNLSFVKLFPAEVVGGVKMLKALYGPYSAMSFMPTGGITLDSAPEYLAQPNVVCVGGSWIVTDALLNSKDFTQIEANARTASGV